MDFPLSREKTKSIQIPDLYFIELDCLPFTRISFVPLLRIILLHSFLGSSSSALSSLHCSENDGFDFECTQNCTSKMLDNCVECWISFSVTQLPDGISACISVPLRHSIFVIMFYRKNICSRIKNKKKEQKTFYRKIPKPQNHILCASLRKTTTTVASQWQIRNESMIHIILIKTVFPHTHENLP